MTLFFARKGLAARSLFRGRAGALLAAALLSIAVPALAQAAPSQTRSNTQVIFSRSMGANGQTATTPRTAAAAAGLPAVHSAWPVTDAERKAITFTAYDLDVHLRPADHYIAVRALATVRNDGNAALARIPLQLSSSLRWERIRAEGRDTAFKVADLNSDADHTGQLVEASVPLAHPLAPGASLSLDVTYSGTIAPNAQRLLALGAPDGAAMHSDWDGITPDFTGLRGFGNVVWYPVSSAPALLGDGATLFNEIGKQKLRLEGARFRLHLADEFPDGAVPTVALINGHSAALTVTGGSDGVPGLATAEVAGSMLGFEAPSLFVAVRRAEQAPGMTLWTLPGDAAAVPAWSEAAAAVKPLLENWLGRRPRAHLAVLDLPDPDDAPFETGAMLATGVGPAAPEQINAILVHALARACMQSPSAWLNEGVAQFIETLWVEKEDGRARALEMLEAGRLALALAEPASPGISAGQPLATAYSPIYYRTKAAYVLWMLRGLVGDSALRAALHAYNPSTAERKGPDPDTAEFEKLVEESAGRQTGEEPDRSGLDAGQSAARDLQSFFADWVDTDKGLPDLSIAKVYTEPAQAGNTLVGITVANAGYASAEVPITVSAAGTKITQRVTVPARGQIVRRILIFGRPTQVQVNDGTVPEVEASIHVTHLEQFPK